MPCPAAARMETSASNIASKARMYSNTGSKRRLPRYVAP